MVIRHEPLASAEERIVGHLQVNDSINNREARLILNRPEAERSVRRLFEKLIEAGEISRRSRHRSRRRALPNEEEAGEAAVIGHASQRPDRDNAAAGGAGIVPGWGSPRQRRPRVEHVFVGDRHRLRAAIRSDPVKTRTPTSATDSAVPASRVRRRSAPR